MRPQTLLMREKEERCRLAPKCGMKKLKDSSSHDFHFILKIVLSNYQLR
jgi:hypothetical protein